MPTVEVWIWMTQKNKDTPFFPEITAEVNLACLGVCTSLRAIKLALFPVSLKPLIIYEQRISIVKNKAIQTTMFTAV